MSKTDYRLTEYPLLSFKLLSLLVLLLVTLYYLNTEYLVLDAPLALCHEISRDLNLRELALFINYLNFELALDNFLPLVNV